MDDTFEQLKAAGSQRLAEYSENDWPRASSISKKSMLHRGATEVHQLDVGDDILIKDHHRSKLGQFYQDPATVLSQQGGNLETIHGDKIERTHVDHVKKLG